MKYWRINTDRNARKDVRICDLWYEHGKVFAGNFPGNKGNHDSVFRKLSIGDNMFMHHSGLGIVGYGIVKEMWDHKTYEKAAKLLYKEELYEYRISVDWDVSYDCRNNPLPIFGCLPYRGTYCEVDPKKYDINSILNNLHKRVSS